MAIATDLRNKILDKVFRNVDFTISDVYISLHTADPGLTGTSEVTGGSYSRQALVCSAAASGNIENSATISFTNMPAATITHFGIWSASTAGSFLWGGTVTPNKTVNAGDTFQFTTGNIDISLS